MRLTVTLPTKYRMPDVWKLPVTSTKTWTTIREAHSNGHPSGFSGVQMNGRVIMHKDTSGQTIPTPVATTPITSAAALSSKKIFPTLRNTPLQEIA